MRLSRQPPPLHCRAARASLSPVTANEPLFATNKRYILRFSSFIIFLITDLKEISNKWVMDDPSVWIHQRQTLYCISSNQHNPYVQRVFLFVFFNYKPLIQSVYAYLLQNAYLHNLFQENNCFGLRSWEFLLKMWNYSILSLSSLVTFYKVVWVNMPGEVDSLNKHDSALNVAAICKIWLKVAKNV